VVHTGPKTQFGGENDGFSIVWYHVETDSEVKMEPITPAIRGTAIEIPRRRLSFLEDTGGCVFKKSLPRSSTAMHLLAY
jgi:hypothetical protein